MAQSPTAQHRARLIREMSRDLNRTRRPSPSQQDSQLYGIAESTGSTFDPDNEALMSTRQIDTTAQLLPQLRASAQKYNPRSHMRREPSEPAFTIDTSALGRAFPDFTQVGTSSDDGSMSIEIGRGNKNGNAKVVSIKDDSMDLSAPMAIGDNYELTRTPPVGWQPRPKEHSQPVRDPSRHVAQVRRASLLQKEVVEPSPPPAKTADYVSGTSRQASTQKPYGLAAMHSRVKKSDDETGLTDDRPPTTDLTTRSTRFGSGQYTRPESQDPFPANFSSTKEFMKSISHGGPNKTSKAEVPADGTFSSATHPPTQQSYVLPDMPNLSELVSGVYQDGTPVFSRNGKPRGSRMSSASRQQHRLQKLNHVEVAEIPVPEDEKAIYVSLKLLQDKVAELEVTRAENQKTIGDLQHRNQTLEIAKAEAKRWRRSDSALGTTDSGSDDSREVPIGSRKNFIEKTRLEAMAKGLQQQLNDSQRKTSVSEITAKNLIRERDAAISQLGVAFLTTQQLKDDNEALQEENDQLRIQLAQLGSNQHDDIQRQVSSGGKVRQAKNERRQGEQNCDQSVRHSRSRSDEKQPTVKNSKKSSAKHTVEQGASLAGQYERVSGRLNKHETVDIDTSFLAQGLPHANGEFARIGVGKTNARGPLRQQPSGAGETKEDTHVVNSLGLQNKRFSQPRTDIDSTSHNAKHLTETKSNTHQDHNDAQNRDDASQDLTYLTWMNPENIAQLRKNLEQERTAGKHGASKRLDVSNFSPDSEVDESSLDSTPSPRNRSPRDFTRDSTRKQSTGEIDEGEREVEQTKHSVASTTHNRRHSEESFLNRHQQRRNFVAEDMTSAFILPDITIRNPAATVNTNPIHSTAAQQVVDSLAQHNGRNCTVCRRVIEHGIEHEHDETKQSVKIPKPVPVSKRMPESTEYEEEPTIRPSQPPADALAVVLKGLEDECTHLKIDLAHCERLFNQHDPALSKRRRARVSAKIQHLVQAINVKSDQIYALYDVLEGQKADGHEISEKEVENTLLSMGIDLDEMALRGGGGPTDEQINARDDHVDSGSDISESLPSWAGFEHTAETGRSKSGTGPRRRSWVS